MLVAIRASVRLRRCRRLCLPTGKRNIVRRDIDSPPRFLLVYIQQTY